jgi:hypothetical protein
LGYRTEDGGTGVSRDGETRDTTNQNDETRNQNEARMTKQEDARTKALNSNGEQLNKQPGCRINALFESRRAGNIRV